MATAREKATVHSQAARARMMGVKSTLTRHPSGLLQLNEGRSEPVTRDPGACGVGRDVKKAHQAHPHGSRCL